ncbi:FMN-binding protein MioC [Shewanella sp. NFH-SH190041]|uniref:FMN-binding protein MioC n=1 Tax=Shewanella sp. NFH-SH190041 TaxID=2950245 RepID=UPI0021C3D1FA|nr:FMN-binding protein MioC [Shewanella sp. NFH-SH190041]BDM66201.1 FMN-binding protein MioC [Shewanella sp. NFH-SH190041]
MSKFDILVGTTLGGSEYVAEELAAQLEQAGHQAKVYLDPQLGDLDTDAIWLVVSATHGAGDLPDNLQPFLGEIQTQSPDLNGIQYALCAIGDSSYDTFCQGPEQLIRALEQAGAKPCVDKIQIDVQGEAIPEEAAQSWLASWQDQL